MNGQSFSLTPFPSAGILSGLVITGNIGRRANTLIINYELYGPIAEVMIPEPADIPVRKNELWKETCFEFFLGLKNHDCYWEFNLSPAGHWNVYRFESYREGMKEEPAFTTLPFTVQAGRDTLRLSLEADLDRIVRADQALEAGISAVIKTGDGKISYWALTHPGPSADFHRREGFVIGL
jgi:hypothetical protein